MTPRSYYNIAMPDFESKSHGVNGDNFRVKADGYCFAYDSFGNELICFVFTITPLEKNMPFVSFPILIVTQNEEELMYDQVPGSAYDFRNGVVNAMTKPWLTNGFVIPYTAVYDALKDEQYHISFSYKLENLEDDVTLKIAQTDIPEITVPIPSDAFFM